MLAESGQDGVRPDAAQRGPADALLRDAQVVGDLGLLAAAERTQAREQGVVPVVGTTAVPTAFLAAAALRAASSSSWLMYTPTTERMNRMAASTATAA